MQKEQLVDRGNKKWKSQSGERCKSSVSTALLIRQEMLCACVQICVFVLDCLYVHVCTLHPRLLPLSPPDTSLPVTAAWRSQIRPSSTFHLPVDALYSIQHQFQPTMINPLITVSHQNKCILSSLNLYRKLQVFWWTAVSIVAEWKKKDWNID